VERVFFLIFSLSIHAISPPLQDILDYFSISVEEVKEKWVQQGKERWEFDERYESERECVWPLFERARYIFEIAPTKMHYEYALVFGALLSTAQKRIAYLKELLERGIHFDRIVFLTGERLLLDSEKTLCFCTTEKEMIEWVYEHSDLPKKIPVLFIDSPMQEKRPTTKDTIDSWLETEPKIGSCLAISSQPYVLYQDSVLRSVISEEFEIETVGPQVTGNPTVALILDTVAKEITYRKNTKEKQQP